MASKAIEEIRGVEASSLLLWSIFKLWSKLNINKDQDRSSWRDYIVFRLRLKIIKNQNKYCILLTIRRNRSISLLQHIYILFCSLLKAVLSWIEVAFNMYSFSFVF